MDWAEILSVVLGGSGLLTSISAICMLRVKRDSAEIENLKQVIGTLQEERDRADKRIEANEKKLDLFARRDLIKMRAINMAPGCRFIPEGKACPVLEQLHADCEKNEGVCRID